MKQLYSEHQQIIFEYFLGANWPSVPYEMIPEIVNKKVGRDILKLSTMRKDVLPILEAEYNAINKTRSTFVRK